MTRGSNSPMKIQNILRFQSTHLRVSPRNLTVMKHLLAGIITKTLATGAAIVHAKLRKSLLKLSDSIS